MKPNIKRFVNTRTVALVIHTALFCGIALPISAPAASFVTPPPRNKVVVVFRYDDYSAKPEEIDFGLRLLTVLTHRGIPCTFGVVPYVCSGDVHDPQPQQTLPLDKNDTAVIRDAITTGLLEVAQHGYSHQTMIPQKPRHWTEFAGRTKPDQIDRIRQGQKLLESIFGEITTFIPPWNSYDIATIEAARDCGFKIFSADIRGPSTACSLQFLPSTTNLRELKQVCQLAMTSRENRPVIVVLFHSFDFRELNPVRGYLTFPQFSELLDWIASQPEIATATIRGAEADNADHYVALQSFYLQKQLLPSKLLRRLPLELPPGTYPSLADIGQVRTRLWAIILLFYSSIIGVFAGGSYWMRRRLFVQTNIHKCGRVLLITSLTTMGVLLLASHLLSPTRICLLTATIGMNLGWWLHAPKLPEGATHSMTT